MITIIVLAMLIGLIPASIARHKGYNFVPYWAFGTLFWIVAMPVVLLVKDRRRKCLYCAETIKPEANVCPHCQRDLLPHAIAA